MSDLDPYQPIVGKTVESIQSSAGWPVIRFTDGSGLCLTDRWNVEPPEAEFRESLDPDWLDAVPGDPS